MQTNPLLAVAVVSLSTIAWGQQHLDNLIHEAPHNWVQTARELTLHSPSAFAAWCKAKQDGIVTMSEVQAIVAASRRDDVAKFHECEATRVEQHHQDSAISTK